MTFNAALFMATSLAPREATIAVPDLASWFHDAPAEWTVRAITGEELARSNEISGRYKAVAAAVQALAHAGQSESVEAMQSLIGYGTDVPEDLAKRIDYLTVASIAPTIDRSISVKLFSLYPIVAYSLTNKILELTGLGPDLEGKVPHSTGEAM